MKENVLNLVLRRLAESYAQQLPYYGKMYELAVRQGRCLHAEEVDTDLLVDLINQRQDLIKILEDTNPAISMLKEEICQVLGLEEFTVAQLQGRIEQSCLDNLFKALEELSRLLLKIKELDQNNEGALRRHIQETSDNIKRIGKNKTARKAYQPKLGIKDGVFIDYSK